MSILYYFAHAGADHSHGVTSHSHVETAGGEATIFWIIIISAIVAAGLFVAARQFSKPTKARPQEQEKEE